MADVLKTESTARLQLFRDGQRYVDESHVSATSTYTFHASDRVVLATNTSPTLYSLGSVTAGKNLQVVSSRPIKVSLNSTTALWNVGKGTEGGILQVSGSFTSVYLQNTNTTFTATVDLLATD